MLGSSWFVRQLKCVAMVFTAIGSASGLFAQDPSPEISDAVLVAFRKADRDGGRALSLEDFLVGRGAADVAKRDFMLYDFDENGSLSLDEFACVRTTTAFDQPGVLPDYLPKAVDSSMAAIDKAFGNWDQDSEREVNAAQFLQQFIQEMQQLGPNAVRANPREADPNRDGKVSRTEARRFVEIQLGIRRSHGTLMRFPNGNVANHALWLHIDADKNDQASRTEYLERSYSGEHAAEQFKTYDVDQDGVMSFEEFIRIPGRGFTDTVLLFRTMDKNLDARLDPNELLAGSADWQMRLAEHAFPGFDVDQDGLLSLAEFRLTPQANMIMSWTSEIADPNGDDLLTFAEFKFDQMQFPLLRLWYFNRFDTNGDQKLSTTEFYFKVRIPNEFYVMNEDGTGWAPFFKLGDRKHVGAPSVSPDGKSIAFDSFEGTPEGDTVYVMDIEERKPRKLCLGLMPTWFPDGKRLALTRSIPQRGVWTMHPSDENNAEFHAPGWAAQMSPDGQRIAYYEGRELKAYNVKKKTIDVLLPANEHPYQQIFWNFTWSPDSTRICIKGLSVDNTQEMLILDPSAAPKLKSRASTKKSMVEDPAWHPNNRRIVIGMTCDERNHMQMYEFDPDTNDPPTLVKGQDPARHYVGGCWTPDGKRMIVVSRGD